MFVRKLLLLVLMVSCLQDGLAQELVFGQPVKLGFQINSDDEELGAMLSDDGKTLYFSRAFHTNNAGGKYAGTDIWVSKKDENGNWLPASNAGSPWNNKQSNAVIGINHDHTVVYLLNAYSNKSGIAFSKLYSGAWGAPEFIPIAGINRDDFVGFYVSPTFDVILISMKGKDSYGEEDLYVSLKDSFGKWTEPQNLGTTVNTKGFEISPFLSQDKKRLYFSSNGHPGLGDADIFYSDRLYDSWVTWTSPKNLGDKINSAKFDGYFSINEKNQVLFLGNRGYGIKSDIFYTEILNSKENFKLETSYTSEFFISNRLKFKEEDFLNVFGVLFDPVIEFRKNTNEISPESTELIWFIGSEIAENKEIYLELIGYDDEEDQKMGFAIQRVNVIYDFLISLNIDSSRLIRIKAVKDTTSNMGDGKKSGVEIIFYWIK